ncbi:MAG: hypothetical protein ABSE67_07335 [Xanthobacteraceae bacterium]
MNAKRSRQGALCFGARPASFAFIGRITARAFHLSAYLRDWLAEAPKPKGSIKLDIDVDPQSFL